MNIQEKIECYKGMSSQLVPYVNGLLKAFDLSDYKTAVDLGGESKELSPNNALQRWDRI